MAVVLDFEKPIVEIQKKIDELKKMSEASGMDLDNLRITKRSCIQN